jgi:hypothetical protein
MTHIAGVCVSVSRCVSGPVAHAESWTLTLFLTSNGARNVGAVRDAGALLRRHPERQRSGVLLGEVHDLGAMRPQVQEVAGQGVPWVVDAAAAEREGLTNTPAVLVQYGERTIRAAGRPDVERIWRSPQNHEK